MADGKAGEAKCVFILEDSVLVSMALENALTEQGYRVVSAASLSDAAQAVASAKFACAILDYILPDGPSGELARLLSERMRVAFVSGAGSDVIAPQFSDFPLFRKPVDMAELLRWVAGG